MDELTAVRQLLAQRPPPAPETVAAAWASLELAALQGTRGRMPLHLNGSPGVPDPGQPAGRRWRGWLVPAAAALAVVIAVALSLAISDVVGGRPGGQPAARPAAAFAQVPRYFVALTGNAVPGQGPRAVAVATATGKVLGSVAAPAPYRVFTWVAAAGDDRTFVLAAQRARPVGGVLGQVMGAGAAKLYRLVLHRSGRPGALEPLSLPLLSGNINGFALSPDGTKLAVSTTRGAGAAAGGSQIQVFTPATGAVRSWVLTSVGWVGQDKPGAESLAWAGDNRTLLFKEYLGEGGRTAQIRLLDTAAPGGSLDAASTRVPFPSSLVSGRVEDPEQAYGIMLPTPDGHKVITVVTTDSWHGRPGFAPSGPATGITRGMLPARCRGSAGRVLKRTPYCINRLRQLERGTSGKSSALHSALRRNAARQQAQSSTALAFTEVSAATARPVRVLGRLQGEGQGIVWAEVAWASPDGTAMIIDGAWPTAGGSWPVSHGGPPVPVAGVLAGGTFSPFPQRVQALYFRGQAAF